MKSNHGANLFELSKNLNIDKTDFIDFSSNINPYGLSPKAVDSIKNNLHLASIYPDPNYVSLRKSIATYCSCNMENIILGSGATELISSTINLIQPKKALLFSPTYSEYEKELNNINCEIQKFFYLKENQFKPDFNKLKDLLNMNFFDLIVICNPNNPTGTLINLEELLEISESFNGYILIDETYIEFTNFEKSSAINLINKVDNIIIIRGTSKFFATPGIRLGYAILSEGEILNKFKSLPNLWNINIFASLMGEAMFTDEEYIKFCRESFLENFNLLFSELEKISDFKIYSSNANFILCEILNEKYTSKDLYDFLITKKIIIRDASSFEMLDQNFFRVCVLTKENILNLITEIKNFINIKQ